MVLAYRANLDNWVFAYWEIFRVFKLIANAYKYMSSSVFLHPWHLLEYMLYDNTFLEPH